MQLLKTIAFTYSTTPIKELNRFFLHEENRKERLSFLRYSCDISEILYLATCNRIEFVFTCSHDCDKSFLKKFFSNFRQDWNEEEIDFAVEHAVVFEGEEALRHIFRVASSLDSLVIGEREIITQVRKSYDTCKSEGLTGDLLRIVIKSTITTAKQVYTNTRIAINPVSVVSLAERELRTRKLRTDSRIVMIGAGETNTNLSKYLIKRGFRNFAIFNRGLDNANKFAENIQTSLVTAKAYPLSELQNYQVGFDILIVCTSSPDIIITSEVYKALLHKENKSKVVVDLSVPSNIHHSVLNDESTDLIDISRLRTIAENNLVERKSEFYAAEDVIEENICLFRQMHRTRRIEVKMKDVPEKIRQIKDRAMNDVFAEDIRGLDEHSREVLGKVLDYMEKKCISVPMIMAKEIILETSN